MFPWFFVDSEKMKVNSEKKEMTQKLGKTAFDRSRNLC